MTNDDYKKYSLENLSKWFQDAISSTEATPEEIYDTLKEVVKEEYSYYLGKLSRISVLSYRFGVSTNDLIKPKSIEEIKEAIDNNSTGSWTKEDVLHQRNYYESNNSVNYFTNIGAPDITDTITFISCDANDTSPGCKSSWYSFWNDQYQTPKDTINNLAFTQVGDFTVHNNCTKDSLISSTSSPFISEDGDVWGKDKVTKWVLPVEVDGLTGDCVVTLPDDLLERVGWVEGDTVEFVSNTNGSFTVKKVVKSEVENI